MTQFYVAAAALVSAAFFAGCVAPPSGSSTGSSGAPFVAVDGANSDSAVAVGVASGAVAQGSGQNVGLRLERTPLERLESLLSPLSTAMASNACPLYSAGDVCSGQSITLGYPACSFGTSTATWIGGQTLTFGGTATCGTTHLPLINNGDTVRRTFSGTIPNGNATTRTTPDGVSVQLDSTTITGYAFAANGGMTITGNGTGQSITINGVNLVGPLWNHTVTTQAPLVVASPGATRVIETGTILIQHNTAQYVAAVTFSNVAYDGTSCFPQSGEVLTSFTGAIIGQEKIVFTGGGSATITTAGGQVANFNLVHCF